MNMPSIPASMYKKKTEGKANRYNGKMYNLHEKTLESISFVRFMYHSKSFLD